MQKNCHWPSDFQAACKCDRQPCSCVVYFPLKRTKKKNQQNLFTSDRAKVVRKNVVRFYPPNTVVSTNMDVKVKQCCDLILCSLCFNSYFDSLWDATCLPKWMIELVNDYTIAQGLSLRTWVYRKAEQFWTTFHLYYGRECKYCALNHLRK